MRQSIREQTNLNLLKSRDDMVAKYKRKKGKRIASFEIEDHVSCEIPKKIRKKADITRLPCVVIDVTNDKYKLMCQYGIIAGTFDASSFIKYPWDVRGNAEKKVTLNSAALKFLGK